MISAWPTDPGKTAATANNRKVIWPVVFWSDGPGRKIAVTTLAELILLLIVTFNAAAE